MESSFSSNLWHGYYSDIFWGGGGKGRGTYSLIISWRSMIKCAITLKWSEFGMQRANYSLGPEVTILPPQLFTKDQDLLHYRGMQKQLNGRIEGGRVKLLCSPDSLPLIACVLTCSLKMQFNINLNVFTRDTSREEANAHSIGLSSFMSRKKYLRESEYWKCMERSTWEEWSKGALEQDSCTCMW